MELLHPGVYVQEISSGVRPIEGVSTSTAAFIGPAERGPLDRAFLVTSFTEFDSKYGSFMKDSWLAHAALQFFNNGGRRLYVARVAKNAATASVSLADRQIAPAKTLTVSADSPGEWGNTLIVSTADATQDASNEFKLIVQREKTTQPLTTETLEVFDNLSMNPDAPNFVEKVVNAKSQFVRVAAEATDSTAAGFSRSGATPAASLPATNRGLLVNINGDGPQLITLADPLTAESQVAAAIQTAVRTLQPLRASTDPTAFSGFTAVFADGVYTLTSGKAGRRSSVEVTDAPANNAAALLKLGKTRAGVEQSGAAVLRPVNGNNIFVGDAVVAGVTVAITPGSDGDTPQEVDYQNGFKLLDSVRDVNLIAVPGIGTATMVDFGGDYCRRRADCFFIGDMGVTDDTKEDAQAFVAALTVRGSYSAVYYPWVRATDPTGESIEPISLPPSGYVTGLYARIDAKRGVWKAPAGTQANLGGAVGLAKETSDAEQDTLNPIGVNVIRSFPAAGLVVWGARTITSDPEWRYVPVRRTAVYLEQSIYNGIQWAVFEPNDEELWSSIRLNINAFMTIQFQNGAFQGRSAGEAFFVKCDDKTTTQADIDAGIVNILVGFAPLKPAEFVVLKLSQKALQPAA
ncbi:MAG TPA: phage tail sheath subtilisin-like domain-containing protein [Pyrinomonadaceae bacterium]|nr:phage tail sheath subtilisin-like domain-containing protein [Pyrinomonadaceae bacterium]